MDFAVSGPLVRCSRLVPGSCPSTRTFAKRFLQTSPCDDSPCVVANPSPPSGWVKDFHLQATEHAQHTSSPLRGGKSREARNRWREDSDSERGGETRHVNRRVVTLPWDRASCERQPLSFRCSEHLIEDWRAADGILRRTENLPQIRRAHSCCIETRLKRFPRHA